jgi:altronate hydrolase
VATRNYIGVLSTVNCSATVTRLISDECRLHLADHPNVDGAVALCHGFGCEGPDVPHFDSLQRTLSGFARHPNFAGVLVVGLGCEGTDVDLVLEGAGLEPGPMLHVMRIQEQGGTRATVDKAVERIREMLPTADACRRQPVPASHLIVGLHCGGSDAYSGITANPALGVAADLLVRNGATVILSETPEICGAEHLLTCRAASHEVGKRLTELTQWWQEYAVSVGMSLDDNLSAGNRAGGLSNIWEKALGAVAKAGSTDLQAVYRYADRIETPGLVFMDTPGYDPIAVTGLVAGSANLICFTTGRGSVSGCKPAPCLKLSSNTLLYRRMTDDMDVNCGVILDGDTTVDEVGEQIFQRILATASGEKTKSEQLGVGDDEFMPWPLVPVL